jgi:multicomponent Na+:H+ antiporter subunit C
VSPNLTLVIVSGVLVASGVALLLERTLTRVLIGIMLLGNGVNILFLVASGRPGGAPFYNLTAPADMSDPLPQAMVLTAIVITFGMVAFVLAMAYRSWQLNGHDEVQDDVEDRRIVRRAELDEVSASFDDDSQDERGADDVRGEPLSDAVKPDDSAVVGRD